jgi:hypothetical protein
MSRQHFPIGLDLYNQDIKDLKIFPQDTITNAEAYLGATSGKIVYSKETEGGVKGRLKYRTEEISANAARFATLATMADVGSQTLAGLTDTTITSAVDAHMLLYDTSGNKWVNKAMSGDAQIAKTGVITIATVPVTKGGTGLTSITQGEILYGSGPNTIAKLAKAVDGTSFLKSSGTANNPVWGKVAFSDLTGVPVSTYLSLADTPTSYAAKAVARVNASASGLVWDTKAVFIDQSNLYETGVYQTFRSGFTRLQESSNQIVLHTRSQNNSTKHLYIPYGLGAGISGSNEDTIMTNNAEAEIYGSKYFVNGSLAIQDSAQNGNYVRIFSQPQTHDDNEAYIPNFSGGAHSFVFDSLEQTLENKWIHVEDNMLHGGNLGDILVCNDASIYERFGKGSENQILKSTSSTIAWGSVDWNELTGVQPLPTAHAIDGDQHTLSGATVGTFMKATSATTFGFVGHGLTTTEIPEGTNYYFTNGRVLNSDLAGYVDPAPAWTPLLSSNNILEAFTSVQKSLYRLNELVESGVNYLSPADVVFDNASNPLPTTVVQIDNQNVFTGMRVLVLNSSEPSQIHNIYVATVSGSTISWGSVYTPTVGDTVWIKTGVMYGATTWYYESTKWVQIGGASSYTAGNLINIVNNQISLAAANSGYEIIAKVSSGAGSFGRLNATVSNTVLKRGSGDLIFDKIVNEDIHSTADIAINKLKGTHNRFIIGDANHRLTNFSLGSEGNIIRRGSSAPEWTTYTIPGTIAPVTDINKVLLASSETAITLEFIANANISNTASIAWSKLASMAVNSVVVTNVATGALETAANLNVPRGGTGRSSLTAGSLLQGNGTNAPNSIPSGEIANTFLRSLGNNSGFQVSQWVLPSTAPYVSSNNRYLKNTANNVSTWEQIGLSEMPSGVTKTSRTPLSASGHTINISNSTTEGHGFNGPNDYITDVMVWNKEGTGFRKFNCDFHIDRIDGENYNRVTINTGGSNIQWGAGSYVVITAVTVS